MSWTNSFLFAAQHAIRREKTDIPCSPPDSISITILDTRKVPQGTFLPATALLKGFNIESSGKLQHEYYHGEYLSQGRLPSDTIITTTLAKLIEHGLYTLYPPFSEDQARNQLFLRVRQFRQTFTDAPKVPAEKEIKIAQEIATACFLHIDIRPVIMMTLLSLKPRYRLEPKILKAGLSCQSVALIATEQHQSMFLNISSLQTMMHDVYAHMQRCLQIERAAAVNPLRGIFVDIAESMNQLHLTRDRSNTNQSNPETSSTSQQEHDKETHQNDKQDADPDIPNEKIRQSSPKIMLIEMMDEEEEEQKRALDQIDDCYEETRPCPECTARISETCFRRDHFAWCTVHEYKNEEEAYWAEVEENAVIGGGQDFESRESLMFISD
ncbi:hypothetical protein PTNB73_09880 [Pyrenophora teres f. teres]|nr:hypothetical protein PTNB73_09880 [Pyrenophora teres f. teres]